MLLITFNSYFLDSRNHVRFSDEHVNEVEEEKVEVREPISTLQPQQQLRCTSIFLVFSDNIISIFYHALLLFTKLLHWESNDGNSIQLQTKM